MAKVNWKKHLLQTSVPLEHEAARILSQCGFSVSADYPYTRLDGAVEKECSVDVRGVKGLEAPGHTRWGCVFDVLVECKYRHCETTWLFLPQPKARSSQLHETIQYVDLFSPNFVSPLVSFSDEDQVNVCYSAVEIGESDQQAPEGKEKGRAFEAQLRRGVRQLQYALPALVALRARWAALNPPDENFPFFFVPIVLTNAKLMVAHHDFGVKTVENAETLESLGTAVSRVIWTSELGPDFHLHSQRQLGSLRGLVQTENIKAVEERRKAAGLADWLQPTAVAARLALDGGAATDIAEFTEVLVVDVESLPSVVNDLSAAFERMARTLRSEPIFRG